MGIMTREEEIEKAAQKNEWISKSLNLQSAFTEGVKWADEHPNLYNDEKYHTVKVSCLDELNRKVALYDALFENSCEYIRTREKERKQAAQAYYPSGSLHEERTVSAFVRGAKWADENPQGMAKMRKDYEFLFLLKKRELIKKACDWLNKTLYIHTEEIEDKHWNEIKTFDWVTSDFDSVSDFIDGFLKAIEE